MATLRNKRKLAAVSREAPENTRHIQSQSTLDPGMAQEYTSQVSEEVEGKVTKKLSEKFSQAESRILDVFSNLDVVLLDPQVRTCSVAVPGTSRNNDSENREPTADRSLGNSCPEAVFSTYHSCILNDSEQEETHHISHCSIDDFIEISTIFWSKQSKSSWPSHKQFQTDFSHETFWFSNELRKS